jgi:hypothetical protein
MKPATIGTIRKKPPAMGVGLVMAAGMAEETSLRHPDHGYRSIDPVCARGRKERWFNEGA